MRLIDKLALSVAEVAELLSVDRTVAYALLRDGKFGDPSTMRLHGGRGDYRVPTASVMAYVERLGATPVQESA